MKPTSRVLPLLLALVSAAASAQLQSVNVLRPTQLRADKLADAPVVRQLPAGARLDVLSLEGGWVLADSAGQRGWLRASSVDLRAAAFLAPGAATGREARNDGAVALGVRSLPPRSNRHALIIGVSRYADTSIPSLPGARLDRESATQMAGAMQVPRSNITYLQDEQATGDAIRRAVRELDERVQPGDRVFIHFSGHGTRYNDPAAGGCVEALLAHDGGLPGTITNREMAQMLSSVTAKTDKLFVMYDACHSGGLVSLDPMMRNRGLSVAGDEGRLRPKFASISEECARPINVKSRNLLVESVEKGTLPQDIIHLSSSRDNEVSFDDEFKGGLATQFMRDCMLRDAKDTDGSGAISIDEIRACAQTKIEHRMQADATFKPPHMVLSGNSGFVPAWFGSDQLANQAVAALPPAIQPAPAAAVPVAAPAPQPVAAPPVPLTGAEALRQLFEQRDAKRNINVATPKPRLQVGRDELALAATSDRAGYLYVAMAGSDNRTLQLLFPNDLDADNRIQAGQTVTLPRANWRLRAGGPGGVNHLLVMVADGPRDLAALAQSKSGPFVVSLNDAAGRAQLGGLMTRSRAAGAAECSTPAARKKTAACSDAFGASLVQVEEVP
jgi:hypothetical protein